MKGFYIFVSETRKGAVDCLELGDIVQSHRLEFAPGTMIEEIKMQALVSKETISKCSKDDTYDFEIGALIALMKMCGKEKALKAVEELYFLKEPRGADLDGDILESKVEHMAKKNAELLGENSRLNYIKSCNESTIDSLVNTRDLLINKNNELIEENEKLKSDKDKSWKIYQRNIQKKQDRINALQAQVKASEDDKQIDSCKYASPVNQLTVDSLIEQSRAFTRKCVDEWLYKIPTKREEMWEGILELHKTKDVIIKVNKEDINTFWHELEERIPEITWCCGAKIFESKLTRDSVQNNAKKTNAIYFRVRTNNWLSYASDPCTYKGFEYISYLPPMRWDLFNQGRFAVKINYDNYKEFYEACEKELGKKPSGFPILGDDVTISICKKDGNFEIFTIEDQKETGKKIVDWEDVR